MQQTKNLGPRRLRTEQQTSDSNSQPTGVTHGVGLGGVLRDADAIYYHSGLKANLAFRRRRRL
jgi:anti-sigma regulatory factor (Ser/Thr protein kinase)